MDFHRSPSRLQGRPILPRPTTIAAEGVADKSDNNAIRLMACGPTLSPRSSSSPSSLQVPRPSIATTPSPSVRPPKSDQTLSRAGAPPKRPRPQTSAEWLDAPCEKFCRRVPRLALLGAPRFDHQQSYPDWVAWVARLAENGLWQLFGPWMRFIADCVNAYPASVPMTHILETYQGDILVLIFGHALAMVVVATGQPWTKVQSPSPDELIYAVADRNRATPVGESPANTPTLGDLLKIAFAVFFYDCIPSRCCSSSCPCPCTKSVSSAGLVIEDGSAIEALNKTKYILPGYKEQNVIPCPTTSNRRPVPKPMLAFEIGFREEGPARDVVREPSGELSSKMVRQSINSSSSILSLQYFPAALPLSKISHARGHNGAVVEPACQGAERVATRMNCQRSFRAAKKRKKSRAHPNSAPKWLLDACISLAKSMPQPVTFEVGKLDWSHWIRQLLDQKLWMENGPWYAFAESFKDETHNTEATGPDFCFAADNIRRDIVRMILRYVVARHLGIRSIEKLAREKKNLISRTVTKHSQLGGENGQTVTLGHLIELAFVAYSVPVTEWRENISIHPETAGLSPLISNEGVAVSQEVAHGVKKVSILCQDIKHGAKAVSMLNDLIRTVKDVRTQMTLLDTVFHSATSGSPMRADEVTNAERLKTVADFNFLSDLLSAEEPKLQQAGGLLVHPASGRWTCNQGLRTAEHAAPGDSHI
jgi:hypothetical protein